MGAILGTASYMSPEHARGKAVDKQTDIWAFGCCLYEALSGRKAFAGETATDTILEVVRSEPNWNDLPAGTSTSLRRVLRRCLEKDPHSRTRDIGDARIEITDAHQETEGVTSSAPVVVKSRRTWLLVTGTALLSALLAWWAKPSSDIPSDVVVRSVIPIPDGDEIELRASSAVALSPDGRTLVYAAERGGVQQLLIRPLDSSEANPIPGTVGAHSPFFSPDGRHVGFFTNDKLRTVPIEGGVPRTLCDVPGGGQGATWGVNETIVVASAMGLQTVPAGGGALEDLTTADPERVELGHSRPRFLPDGKHVLFNVLWGGGSRVGILSLETKQWRTLDLDNAADASYVPSGHLVFGQAGGLSAIPFDLTRMEISNRSVPVIQQIATDPGNGYVGYGVSDNGALVYVPGRYESRLVWVDRHGSTSPVIEAERPYLTPRLSPEGNRIAVSIYDPTIAKRDVWIHDLERGTLARLTTGEGHATDPVWSPDGKRLAYARRQGDSQWHVAISDVGSGSATEIPGDHVPNSWSADGETIFFHSLGSNALISGVGAIQVKGASSAELLIREPFITRQPTLSPDGRWLAYVSDESGRLEIYIKSFPELDRQWLVSTEGGTEPRWSGSGRELFYRNDARMMLVEVRDQDEFSATQPTVLFEKRFAVDPIGQDAVNYDVTPDGQRFLMITKSESPDRLHLITHWFKELKRRVPAGNTS